MAKVYSPSQKVKTSYCTSGMTASISFITQFIIQTNEESTVDNNAFRNISL